MGRPRRRRLPETVINGQAPLSGFRVVNTGVNLPAVAASGRLTGLGAAVTKVEPPEGDPLEVASRRLYAHLTEGQEVVRLNLKEPRAREQFGALLECCDVLLTSSRPSALARLGLSWPDLESRYAGLVQVAIVGKPAPDQEIAGHDLTYLAPYGLLSPPTLPRTLAADLGGAERAVTAAVSLLLSRGRGSGGARYAEVALADSAAFFALPWSYGLTRSDGPLGGAFPFYDLYEAKGGWIAVAALEPRFRERLAAGLGVEEPGAEAFAQVFRTRTPLEWEQWAIEHDLPLAAVSEGDT
jgi:crotonobetainyl-CoA:carnitine CoA-transferase CaiB-like acyl-CoA transferase